MVDKSTDHGMDLPFHIITLTVTRLLLLHFFTPISVDVLRKIAREIQWRIKSLQIRGGAGHPDPEIRGGGIKKRFFGPSGLSLV